MRITGGTLCGRVIDCPDGIIRPAMDKMRESLFSILGDLSEKSFLDLFAGSGILSLEAASRGATQITLVEKDKGKISTIFQNIAIAPVKIECKFVAVELFIKRNKKQFDIIFLDPPFPYKFHEDLVLQCSKTNSLTEKGQLLIHRPSEKKLSETIGNFHRFDQRVYGRSIVDFYRL
ncbi:MAG: 16S rRNA (guanine(966)-N(2))-methyltransferase RsmD [Treponemataceae bacterium]